MADETHYEQLKAAVDAASLLLARHADTFLPAQVWTDWTKAHRSALCDLPSSDAGAQAPEIAQLIEKMRTMALVAGQASVEELDPAMAQADAKFAEYARTWADELAVVLAGLRGEHDERKDRARPPTV